MQAVRRARITRAFALLLLASTSLAQPARAQAPDTSLWVTDGVVVSMLRVGNTLYMGGSFSRVGPHTGSGVPFDAGIGQPQLPFARVPGTVNAVVADGSGGWFVGGRFNGVAGTQRRNLVHLLANGSVAPWSPDPDSEVLALALSGNTLYVGGHFDHLGGQARFKIGAVDVVSGAINAFDPSPAKLGPTIWPYVRSLAVGPGVVYAGGYFLTIGGQTRHWLAALDPATGVATAWDAAADGQVLAIAPAGSTVYVGGMFSNIGGAARSDLAQLSVTTGLATAWDPHADGAVDALALGGSQLYAGGFFKHMGATVRNALAGFDAATGTLTAFDANPQGGEFGTQIHGLSLLSGTLYVAGSFATVGGQPRRHLAAVDATSGVPTVWNPDVNQPAYTVAVAGGSVFAGGQFWIAGGEPRANLAAFDLATGHARPWAAATDNQVTALLTDGTWLYLSGYFITVRGFPRHYVARIELASGDLSAWSANPNNVVTCMALDGGRLYLGGYGAPTLAAFDTATGAQVSWAPTTAGGPVNSIVADPAHGAVVAASQGGMWRFSAASAATLWTETFDPSGVPARLMLVGSTLYIGGDFHQVQGQPRSNLAAVDVASNTLLPWAPNPNDQVDALGTDGARVFAGGRFTGIAGQSRRGVAVVDGVTAALDPFDAGLDGGDYSVSLGGAELYVSGAFASCQGFAVPGTVRLPAPPPLGVTPRPEGSGLGLAAAPLPAIEGTTLRFALPAAGRAWLDVLDLQGRRVASLIDGAVVAAGPATLRLETRAWPPSVYLVRLRTDSSGIVRQIVVMR